MKIYVSHYMCRLNTLRTITYDELTHFDDIEFGIPPQNEDVDQVYTISWGFPQIRTKCGVAETGFFWDAMHIDTIDLYYSCSFNFPQAEKLIRNYSASKSAESIILSGKNPDSKFSQPVDDIYWDGVVLALQNPRDRSIYRGSSELDYFQFVDDACRFYGKHLFLKLHPWNKSIDIDRFTESANRYGCRIGKSNHSILKHCKFCLVFNSTFCVDCFLRRIKVAQYFPGYFWQSKSVHYCNGEFPIDIDTDLDYGSKLCDFMIWKYLIWIGMPVEHHVSIFRDFANSGNLFPLKEELSYAANIGIS